MRCCTNGLEQEPCPLGISAKLARQRWRTRSKLSLSQRPPPGSVWQRCFCYYYFFYLYATGSLWKHEKTKRFFYYYYYFFLKEVIDFWRVESRLPLQSQLLASRPRVVLFAIKILKMSLETDSLTFVHLVQHLSGVGTRTCALFALRVRTAAIKPRWCLHLGWMKADGFFLYCLFVFLTARVGLLNWWKNKKERKKRRQFQAKDTFLYFFSSTTMTENTTQTSKIYTCLLRHSAALL